MKTRNVTLRSAALGLGLLAATAFADNVVIYESYYDSYPWQNGTVYNVPSGAFFEWGVNGVAHAIISGGGLNVNEYGSSGPKYDVGTIAYADSIGYQLSAYGEGGEAYLALNW